MSPDFSATRVYLFIFFFDCKLLYLLCTLPRCTFTTVSIVYLFVSVLFNLQSSIQYPKRHKAVLGVPVQGTVM